MKTASLITLFILSQLSGYNQADGSENFRYKLIYTKFDLGEKLTINERLTQTIPEDLTTELSKSKSHYITNLVTRDIQDILLNEIDYQHENYAIYNDKTIVELGDQVGANALLWGKIDGFGGRKFKIDAKIALIRTGERQVEEYIIKGRYRLENTVPYAKAMRRLAKQMRVSIEGRESPKWLLGLSGAAFLAGGFSTYQSFSMHDKYNNAKTIPDLNRYKQSRDDYWVAACTSFAISGVSAIVYLIANKKARKNKPITNF